MCQSVCCVPWDDAGAFLRFSVTYTAKDEAEEDALMAETLRATGLKTKRDIEQLVGVEAGGDAAPGRESVQHLGSVAQRGGSIQFPPMFPLGVDGDLVLPGGAGRPADPVAGGRVRGRRAQ